MREPCVVSPGVVLLISIFWLGSLSHGQLCRGTGHLPLPGLLVVGIALQDVMGVSNLLPRFGALIEHVNINAVARVGGSYRV